MFFKDYNELFYKKSHSGTKFVLFFLENLFTQKSNRNETLLPITFNIRRQKKQQ